MSSARVFRESSSESGCALPCKARLLEKATCQVAPRKPHASSTPYQSKGLLPWHPSHPEILGLLLVHHRKELDRAAGHKIRGAKASIGLQTAMLKAYPRAQIPLNSGISPKL